MNKRKLKQAEADFLDKYPGGFFHPELEAIGKKHRVEQMVDLAQESFKKKHFDNPLVAADYMTRIISRSSMVSMFEKPKFRDLVTSAGPDTLQGLASGLKSLIHGKGSGQKRGFELLVSTLKPHKLAKWSLITIIPNYYRPDDEVFVKPTTAKGVIQHFELEGLEYKPLPTWDFYDGYRNEILEMKAQVDPSLSPSNAAFCGFLMMSFK